MQSKIKIFVDSNEKGSGRDTALAQAVSENTAFELAGFAELTVDVMFSRDSPCPVCELSREFHCSNCGNFDKKYSTHRVHAELKTSRDFVDSALDKEGHLGNQLKDMISTHEEGIIVVLGNDRDIERCCFQRVVDASRANREDLTEEIAFSRTRGLMGRLGAFEGDAYSCHIPVMKWSPTKLDPLHPYRELLSHVKRLYNGPNLASWLPTFQVNPRSYGSLCAFRGVGDASAKKLLDEIGDFNQLPWKGITPAHLIGILGRAKAKTVLEAYGCEGIA